MATTTSHPRQSAADRKAAEAARLAEAREAFEAKRATHWLELWAKAMRLYLLVQANSDFAQEHSWFADGFRVDPVTQSFQVDRMAVSEATLTYERHANVLSSLDSGVHMMDELLAEKERRRLAEIERQRLVKQALEKLTDEEVAALNLRRPRA